MAFVQDAWRVRQHILLRQRRASRPALCRQAEVPWSARPFNGPRTFSALITLPDAAGGWIVWPRSAQETASRILIARFHRAGLGTLQLLDDCSDLPLEARAERILAATAWLRRQPENEYPLPLSYLGLGEEAAAVLWAAAEERAGIAAVVAGCGRYDELEAKRLTWLWAPTRLLVKRGDKELIWQAREMAKLLVPPHDVVRLWGSRPDGGMARGAAGWYLRWMVEEESRRKRAGAILSRKLRVQRAVRAAKVGLATGALVLGYLPLAPRATQPASSSATVHPDARNPAFASSSDNPFGLVDIGNAADPAFVDIDGDGDLDAFGGNTGAQVVFFRNTGTAIAPAFAASSANPFGITVPNGRAKPAFADIDGDGDLDAFIGDADPPGVVFYRNTGSATAPAFAASSTNPFGVGTGVPYRASPAFADIDGDGDLDAFVGGDGNTRFYRNTGSAASPAFAGSSNNPFGLVSVGGYATPDFADLDGDGDLDALIGNSAGNTVFFQNTGRAVSPAFASSSNNPFGLADIGSNASPTFADLDGDGDLDSFVGNYAGNTVFFRNTGTSNAPNFTSSSTNPFGLVDTGDRSRPAFVDIDADGDLDALVGDATGNTIFLRNTGTATVPAFGSSSVNPFGLADVGTNATPAFADIDGDGDLDALVGNSAGNTVFFRNTGTATSPAFASSSENPFGIATLFGGSNIWPAFVDIDGDGDLDSWMGANNGYSVFFRNTGTATGPLFASSSANPFGVLDSGDAITPAFADLDGDGDLDLYMGELQGNTIFYKNTGTAVLPAFASSSNNPFGLANIGANSVATPAFADLTSDGDMDAFIGEVNGNTIYFRNTANPNTVVVLAWLKAVGGVDGVEVSWKTATESQVLGFHVYRAESAQSTQAAQRLTGELIVARTPGGIGGAEYVYRDTTAVPGRSYAYWLEVTTLSGGTEKYGTAIAGSRE